VKQAFTLIEFLIVIGLIAIAGSLVVLNSEALIAGISDESVDKTLRDSVREARFQAGSLKGTVEMRYDRETASFVLLNENGGTIGTYPTRFDDDPDRLEIIFSQRLPGFGSSPPEDPDTIEIPAVHFRPDRSSTPFAAELVYEGNRYTMAFDPFSDIVIKDSRAD